MVKVAPTLRLNSGFDFPVIGLGTYKGSSPVKIAADGEQRTTGETEQAVKDAIDAGYRHIDCALLYDNEEEVGDAIRAKIEEGVIKREDIFVTTKLWNTFHRPALVEKGCRLSLKKLGLDYLDLYLVHSPMAFKEGDIYYPKNAEGKVIYDDVNILDVWKAMEDLVAKGLVKSIGISNFNSEQINRIVKHAKIVPAVNQIELSPYLTQKKLIKTCKDHGIVVAAYSPLGSPGRNKEFNLLEDPFLTTIGKKYNKSVAQVILRYMVQEGLVPLPKSVTKQRIIDNFNIFDFEMTPQELAQIDGLNKNLRFVQAVMLKDHPEYPFDSD